nr:hypothetical protein GCM10020241_66400 [Streptoalloteichus tenebrarius]
MWRDVTCRNDRGCGRGVDNRFWRWSRTGALTTRGDRGAGDRGQRLLPPSHPLPPALRRIPATIPERRDQQAHRLRRGRAGGVYRPSTALPTTAAPSLSAASTRRTRFRALATRFDKTAMSYQGMIDLTTLLIWL